MYFLSWTRQALFRMIQGKFRKLRLSLCWITAVSRSIYRKFVSGLASTYRKIKNYLSVLKEKNSAEEAKNEVESENTEASSSENNVKDLGPAKMQKAKRKLRKKGRKLTHKPVALCYDSSDDETSHQEQKNGSVSTESKSNGPLSHDKAKPQLQDAEIETLCQLMANLSLGTSSETSISPLHSDDETWAPPGLY